MRADELSSQASLAPAFRSLLLVILLVFFLSSVPTQRFSSAGSAVPDSHSHALVPGTTHTSVDASTEIIVDDQDAGFTRSGPSGGWRHSGSGDSTYHGHAYWTYTTDTWVGPDTNNVAEWEVTLPQAGEYQVLAYIPRIVTGSPDTTEAVYYIYGTPSEYPIGVTVDQTRNQQWISLGTFEFRSTYARIRLTDVSDDWNYQGQRKTILFDAIKWIPTGEPPGPGDGENLVPNPSFEHGATDPDDWYQGIYADWSYTAHTGTRGARVRLTESTSSILVPLLSWRSETISVVPSQRYYFGFWHRMRSDQASYVRASVFVEATRRVADVVVPSAGEWHYDEVSFIAPSDAVEVFVLLDGPTTSSGDLTDGDVVFDDIWLATTPRSGGSQPVSVSIWVDRGEGSTYYVGEQLQLCYSVSRPIYVRVWDCRPGLSCEVILQGDDDGQGDCRNYTVTEPTGREVVRIEAVDNGQVIAQDETYFYVDATPPTNITHTPTPTSTATRTPTRTPTPTSTPTSRPPSESILCGQVVWATTCSNYLQPIFFHCNSETPYLWQPPSFEPDRFYRIYDPTFGTTNLCTREYGQVTSHIVGWSRYEQTTSCPSCGAPPPITPTPRTPVIIVPGYGASLCLAPSIYCGWFTHLARSVYQSLIDAFTSAGYELDEDLFVAFYDWTRSNEDSASRLAAYVEAARRTSSSESVHIVTHSNGANVARSYIQRAGVSHVDTLILIAPPSTGVVRAYPLWEGGDLSQEGGFNKVLRVPLELALTILDPDRSWRDNPREIYQLFHGYVPSLRELLPTGYFYVYERRGETYTPLNPASMQWTNPFLTHLNNSLARLYDDTSKVVVMASSGHDTLDWLAVRPHKSSDGELWVDGKPEQYWHSEDGDGTILFSRASLPSCPSPACKFRGEYTKKHAETLPFRQDILDETRFDTLDELGIARSFAQNQATDDRPLTDELIYLISGATAELLVTDPLGRQIGYYPNGSFVSRIPEASYQQVTNNVKMVNIPNPIVGDYTVQVIARNSATSYQGAAYSFIAGKFEMAFDGEVFVGGSDSYRHTYRLPFRIYLPMINR